jgi:4-diphosphocytidyl-2-C-methyl-D-erythritol kinase
VTGAVPVEGDADGETTVLGHAKVNLVLHVLGRDPTGYHQLETLFQRLALADTVTVRRTAGPRSLEVVWEGMPAVDIGPVEQNLAWRAAAAYAAAAGGPSGWAIALTKRIPAGGGLGGGSADAAAVLRALQATSAAPLPAATLHALAASLGADVAFALGEAPLALGTGYGERLQPLPPLPPQAVELVLPDFGVNTAAAYGALAAARAARAAAGGPAPRARLGPGAAADWGAVSAAQGNDFEATVFASRPELGAVRDQLADPLALVARMSGSGSTLFRVGPPSAAGVALPAGWRRVRTTTL